MWNEIIEHFSTLEKRPLERVAFLVIGLLVFWIIEGSIPLLPMHYKKNKMRHASINFVFTGIHLIIHTFLAILIVALSDWCRDNQFGIIYWFNANTAMAVLIAVLALDFSSWLVHLIMHKVPLLWRFHLIHHTDTSVDVTTGLRHHPGDSILRGLFFMLLIFISGAPMYAVMIYQTLLLFATGFTHANMKLPVSLDKALSYVLISPNMHKVHHHWKQPFTDSNYGAVFSIWDRLLGTFMKMEVKDIRYGIDRDFPEEKNENLWALMKRPFEG